MSSRVRLPFSWPTMILELIINHRLGSELVWCCQPERCASLRSSFSPSRSLPFLTGPITRKRWTFTVRPLLGHQPAVAYCACRQPRHDGHVSNLVRHHCERHGWSSPDRHVKRELMHTLNLSSTLACTESPLLRSATSHAGTRCSQVPSCSTASFWRAKSVRILVSRHAWANCGADACQARGKALTISLGGAAAAVTFSSDAQASTFADTIWNLFLGGSSSTRPFGNAVLDGVRTSCEDNLAHH